MRQSSTGMPERNIETLNEELKAQQLRYNQTWKDGIRAGKEQRGNLKTNLEFLEHTDLLRSGHRILEIGCGIGSVVAELTARACDAIGTDISTEAINYGREKYPNVNLTVMAAEDLKFDDGSFDIVLSFDLFEHIARIDKHVSEVCRVLKPAGYYLLQTPNKYSNALFETLSKKSLKWRRAHPSLHTPGQLRRRLFAHGFAVRFVKMNPINEFTIKKLKKFGPLRHIFTKVNFRHLPLALQTNLYVVAQKTKPPSRQPEQADKS